jgi:hypothetical protein
LPHVLSQHTSPVSQSDFTAHRRVLVPDGHVVPVAHAGAPQKSLAKRQHGCPPQSLGPEHPVVPPSVAPPSCTALPSPFVDASSTLPLELPDAPSAPIEPPASVAEASTLPVCVVVLLHATSKTERIMGHESPATPKSATNAFTVASTT